MPKDDTSTKATPEKGVAEKLDELFAPWNRTDAPGLVVGACRPDRQCPILLPVGHIVDLWLLWAAALPADW